MTQVIEPKAIQPISLPEISKRVSLSKILVTTDFSPESDRALAYALALARRYDARIYLAHVLVPDAFLYAEPAVAEATYEKVRQAAEQGMADILVSGKLRGIPHEVLLGEGNVWPVLAKLIQKYEIDLVVTATHGRGKIKKLLIGSVAEEIFRHADCAVLTVGPRVKDEPPREVELKSILFATDFGHGAERAAAYALSLAQEHAARLTMLHVIQEATAFTEESVRRKREFNIENLRRLVPEGAENWCKPVFRATFGETVEEITTMAREMNADLIVMGAKSRNSLAGHVPATIAYSVVTKARCPVLTVRG